MEYNQMKKLVTARFADIKNCDNFITISIAKYPPKWYQGHEYPDLFSTDELINAFNNKDITTQEYTEKFFNQILCNLDPEKVISDLIELCPDDGEIFICCWGNVGEFCHRHLVSAWINDYLSENPGKFDIPMVKEIYLENCDNENDNKLSSEVSE